ncbi:hypothetical protein D3C76_1355430 [compost metagenome]
MTGDERRNHATFALPQAPQGGGGGQDGRLGLVGLVQALFRTLLAQGPEVVAEGFGGFGKGIAHHGVLRAQVGEHTDRLRTLAGENECEGCGHCNRSLCVVSSKGKRRHSLAQRTYSWMTGYRPWSHIRACLRSRELEQNKAKMGEGAEFTRSK